jgi:hypothetical protein
MTENSERYRMADWAMSDASDEPTRPEKVKRCPALGAGMGGTSFNASDI